MNNSTPELHTLLTGLMIAESPRWHEDRLWFCHWGAHEVIAIDLHGNRQVFSYDPEVSPHSIEWLPDGRLLVTSGKLLLHAEPDGSLISHADLTAMTDPLWNEIVVDGRGNTYINSIGFDLMAGAAFVPGLIALVTPDGSARQVADDVAFPNGMAVTPDNSTLILAELYGHRLTAFDIAPDGGLSNRRVWADLDDGVPDGICIDADGAVWYADVPNKCCVRVREGGQVLQTIELDRGCFACMLGGPDRGTLFMLAAEWQGTAGMSDGSGTGQILTVAAPAPGAGWPSSRYPGNE